MTEEANFTSERPANRLTFIQSCKKFTRKLIAWFPVLFVAGITIYGYYVYVVEYCILTLLEYNPALVVRAVLYLVFVHVLLILFVWSYLTMTFRRPGSPLDYCLERADSLTAPSGWRSDPTKAKRVFVLPGDSNRYCGICDTHKPERCHHCSVCERCILKMDHHCPWFNNCVGYRNYKFFHLSLFYAILLAIFVFGTLLQELIWELANDKTTGYSIQFLIICIFAFILGLSSSVLLSYHLYLVSINMTTLEHIDQSDSQYQPHTPQSAVAAADIPSPPLQQNPYDLGLMENLRQVFGNNILVWLLPWPVDNSQKGLVFPRREEMASRVENV